MNLFLLDNKPPEETRCVKANDAKFNGQFNYKNNKIATSRYNVITFLPMNLFEQFQRIANAYFLALVILQLFPQISPLNPITTIIPLIIVLGITAIKDVVDDLNRHKSDDEINNRKTLTLQGNRHEAVRWMDTCVGDLIKLENNQAVTADVLLLSSSNENNLVYIETAELDGETNIKVRQALPETGVIGKSLSKLSSFNGKVFCEPPNVHLHRFVGKMEWEGKEYALDNDMILLRGCKVRNTDWCIGLVIFAGPDTKLMMNTGKSILKRTSIDRLMNALVWLIFAFLILLAAICAVGNTIWESTVGLSFKVHQPWADYITNVHKSGFLAFWSYIIVLSAVVPISLYVSVEIIRLMQSWFIDWDRLMYYDKKDLPAGARTTTLNEELGQIEYIFSDKTGTLTQNIMVFKKCSIGGKIYGNLHDKKGQMIEPDESTPTVDLSYNPFHEKSFLFYDNSLVKRLKSCDAGCCEFFRLTALCHTVMSEFDGKTSLTYQAQSPDESALVSAARNFGFVFISRTYNTITVKELGKDVTYELLAILDFDNVRKRMSVIVKNPKGCITLYCKGADIVIIDRLVRGRHMVADVTSEHLEEFASSGLRTLCFAMKVLTEKEYSAWEEKYKQASKALQNREEQLAAVYEEIELDMVLLGATAIEDKLQDGVPETIANLALANIKIWVLTGDKEETAINIGYSCNMLTENMKNVFIISGDSFEEVSRQIQDAIKEIQEFSLLDDGGKPAGSLVHMDGKNAAFDGDDGNPAAFGLVISGHSLAFALDSRLEEYFLALASMSSSVICCRITPLQKAAVVELIKKYKSAVTLSIGDGANDVSMIKAADIGVGISGEEGTQAVLAADFSFGQFRFLERLLLVHGRWSYKRMSKFLDYFFYKNFAFTLVHFWYAFFCGFHAQSLYNEWFVALYNVVYTSMPILVLALLDQDLDDAHGIRYPKLYLSGQKNEGFNKKIFCGSVGKGILTSLVLFFFAYGTFYANTASDGRDMTNLESVGMTIASSLIITVNLKVAMETQYWTPINHYFVWGSIAIYFLMTFALSSDGLSRFLPTIFPYVGVARTTMGDANVWLCIILATAACVLPELAIKLFHGALQPTYTDKILMKQATNRKKMPPTTEQVQQIATRRIARSRPKRNRPGSVKSSYAFSHEQGFGEMITSGKMSTMTRETCIPELDEGARRVSTAV